MKASASNGAIAAAMAAAAAAQSPAGSLGHSQAREPSMGDEYDVMVVQPGVQVARTPSIKTVPGTVAVGRTLSVNTGGSGSNRSPMSSSDSLMGPARHRGRRKSVSITGAEAQAEGEAALMAMMLGQAVPPHKSSPMSSSSSLNSIMVMPPTPAAIAHGNSLLDRFMESAPKSPSNPTRTSDEIEEARKRSARNDTKRKVEELKRKKAAAAVKEAEDKAKNAAKESADMEAEGEAALLAMMGSSANEEAAAAAKAEEEAAAAAKAEEEAAAAAKAAEEAAAAAKAAEEAAAAAQAAEEAAVAAKAAEEAAVAAIAAEEAAAKKAEAEEAQNALREVAAKAKAAREDEVRKAEAQRVADEAAERARAEANFEAKSREAAKVARERLDVSSVKVPTPKAEGMAKSRSRSSLRGTLPLPEREPLNVSASEIEALQAWVLEKTVLSREITSSWAHAFADGVLFSEVLRQCFPAIDVPQIQKAAAKTSRLANWATLNSGAIPAALGSPVDDVELGYILSGRSNDATFALLLLTKAKEAISAAETF